MEWHQSTDVYIKLAPKFGKLPPPPPAYAKYILINSEGAVVLEKSLGEGISFLDDVYTIHLTDLDTANILGKYTQECIVKDILNNDFFILKESVKVIKTTARI
jgi:hypothetical protein